MLVLPPVCDNWNPDCQSKHHTATRYLMLGQDMCSMDTGMDDHLLASSLQCIRLRHYILEPSGDGQKVKTHTVLPVGQKNRLL